VAQVLAEEGGIWGTHTIYTAANAANLLLTQGSVREANRGGAAVRYPVEAHLGWRAAGNRGKGGFTMAPAEMQLDPPFVKMVLLTLLGPAQQQQQQPPAAATTAPPRTSTARSPSPSSADDPMLGPPLTGGPRQRDHGSSSGETPKPKKHTAQRNRTRASTSTHSAPPPAAPPPPPPAEPCPVPTSPWAAVKTSQPCCLKCPSCCSPHVSVRGRLSTSSYSVAPSRPPCCCGPPWPRRDPLRPCAGPPWLCCGPPWLY